MLKYYQYRLGGLYSILAQVLAQVCAFRKIGYSTKRTLTEVSEMAIQLFEHNLTAYQAAFAMLSETGKAAVIHPTGTGKSFIGFKLCEDNPDRHILWLSPSDYICRTQLENWSAGGGPLNNVTFLTYAKLMYMAQDALSAMQPDFIVLDEFHRAGADIWGAGVKPASFPLSGSAAAGAFCDQYPLSGQSEGYGGGAV